MIPATITRTCRRECNSRWRAGVLRSRRALSDVKGSTLMEEECRVWRMLAVCVLRGAIAFCSAVIVAILISFLGVDVEVGPALDDMPMLSWAFGAIIFSPVMETACMVLVFVIVKKLTAVPAAAIVSGVSLIVAHGVWYWAWAFIVAIPILIFSMSLAEENLELACRAKVACLSHVVHNALVVILAAFIE